MPKHLFLFLTVLLQQFSLHETGKNDGFWSAPFKTNKWTDQESLKRGTNYDKGKGKIEVEPSFEFTKLINAKKEECEKKLSPGGFFDETTVRVYLVDLLQNVNDLHAQNKFHGNICPKNILLRKDGHIQLIIPEFNLVTYDVENTEYMAPEVVNNKMMQNNESTKKLCIESQKNLSGHSKESDIWALGILTYFLLFGHTPFCGPPDCDSETSYKIIEKNILKCSDSNKENFEIFFPQYENFYVSKRAKDFIKLLLNKDATKRPNKVEELQNHAWFKAFFDSKFFEVIDTNEGLLARRVDHWNIYQSGLLQKIVVPDLDPKKYIEKQRIARPTSDLEKYLEKQLTSLKTQLIGERVMVGETLDHFKRYPRKKEIGKQEHEILGTVKVEIVANTKNKNEPMAMKVISIKNILDKGMLGITEAMAEIAAPSVARIHILLWDQEYIYVVMEYRSCKIDHALRLLRYDYTKKFPVKGARRIFQYIDNSDEPPLGKGTFGIVRKMQRIGTNEYFAVKILNVENIIKRGCNGLEELQSEIGVLSIINSPFTVDMEALDYDQNSVYLILELVSGGDLMRLIKSVFKYKGRFEEDTARLYIAELVMAIEHLHSLNIGHRDIKPENVLVTDDGHLQLTDFGLSKIFQNEEKQQRTVGSLLYMAPEIVNNEYHDKTVDWWSLGVLTYTFFYEDSPFSRVPNNNDEENNNDEYYIQGIIKNIKNTQFIQKIFTDCKDFQMACMFIKKLLVHDPEKRLGRKISRVKSEPFLITTDWSLVSAQQIKMPYWVVSNPTDELRKPYYIDKKAIPEKEFAIVLI